MKKYRNPLKDCGMYRKHILFYYGKRKACPCPWYVHGIPFPGMHSIHIRLSPDSLSMGKIIKNDFVELL